MAQTTSRKGGKRLIAVGCLLVACLISLSIVTGMMVDKYTASAAVNDERTYTSDYSGKEEVSDAALELNAQVAEEGMVLLENDGVLPLKTDWGKKTRITVFGYAAVAPEIGGDQTADDMSSGYVKADSDVFGALENAGYAVNPTVRNFYETNKDLGSDYAIAGAQSSGSATSWTNMSGSFANYADAAVVVIGNSGYPTKGGGAPGSTPAPIEGAYIEGNYKYDENGNIVGTSLTVDDEQLDLIEMASGYFDEVIVVVNVATPIEMGEIDDMYLEGKIDAIVQCNKPGNGGLNALGTLLSGEATFSGHTSDIWARYFDRTPSFLNFGSTFYQDDSGSNRSSAFEEYEEGIYIGYRYYETAAHEMGDDEEWYQNEVVYPFGYGLSYTDFSYEIVNADEIETSVNANTLNVDKNIAIKVKVKNTGDYSGKAVVQLYYEAPYDASEGIEKAYVVLGDYTKTSELKPGQSETVTVKVSPRDMASYKYAKSGSWNGGYVLSAGDYSLKIMEDSHNPATDEKGTAQEIVWTLTGTKEITASRTGYTIENEFDDLSDHMTGANVDQLSRADFSKAGFDVHDYVTPEKDVWIRDFGGSTVTWKCVPAAGKTIKDYTGTNGDAAFEADFANRLWNTEEGKDTPDDPWYADEMPTQADEATRPAQAAVVLGDLTGKDYDDPLWDDLLDELSMDEMNYIVENGGYCSDKLDYIEKPYVRDTDGPHGWTGSGTDGLDFPKVAAEPMIASTWNTDLLYEMGVILGEEGLWGNSDAGSNVTSYTGWYAPGINIHRSYFDGRYEEYYSEDAYLSGTLAAAISSGIATKGGYVYLKHFALFGDSGGAVDVLGDGTSPSSVMAGLAAWCDEQTFREIYIKAFQIAIEEADARGIMVSSSRAGTTWIGASYPLLTNVVRNEWGFRGIIVTDIVLSGYFDSNAFVRAGGNLMLRGMDFTGTKLYTDPADWTATQVACVREAVHGILYVTANCNAMQVPYGAAVSFSGNSTLAGATVGESYAVKIDTAEQNTYTKYGEVTYSVTGGTLPSGLTLNTETGEITGTPTAAGSYTFEVTASSPNYVSDTNTYTITVSEPKTEADTSTGAGSGTTDTGSTGTTTEESSGGCGSIVDLTGTAIVMIAVAIVAGVAVAVYRKRKADSSDD